MGELEQLENNSSRRRSTFGKRRSQNASDSRALHYLTVERIRYRIDASKSSSSESLKALTGCTWKVYRATPFKNFSTNVIRLKRCAVRIKQALVQQIRDDRKGVTFEVQVSTPHVLEDRPNNLEIEVTLLDDKKKPAVKYRGFVLSCDNSYNPDDDLVNLPLVLCAGPLGVIQIVHGTICRLFDTVIHPIPISKEDLFWMSAILCNVLTDDSSKVKFKYTVPHAAAGSSLVVSLAFESLQKLWKCVHAEDNDEITCEEIDAFQNLLNMQFRLVYGVKFELLKLEWIAMPKVTVTHDGHLRMDSTHCSVQVLNFLYDIARILESPYVPAIYRQDLSPQPSLY